MNFAVAPLVAIAGGVVLLLAAIVVLIQQRRIVEVVPYSNVQLELPKKWDDAEITRLLQRHADQPAVLAHAISSIKTRMILNQDIKTAQQRLKLVANVIEVFKLNRELQGILHDVHLAEKDFEIRQVEADIRLEDVQVRQKSEVVLRKLRPGNGQAPGPPAHTRAAACPAARGLGSPYPETQKPQAGSVEAGRRRRTRPKSQRH